VKAELSFLVNNDTVSGKFDPAMVLLDFLRSEKHLTGTKEGCREGDCGACTVLIGTLRNGQVVYQSANSCLMPLANVHNKHVVTIEGLTSSDMTPVQHAFVHEGATQCGFCTPGFIVSLTGYLLNAQYADMEDAKDSIAGNICRCTGHAAIIRAAQTVVTGLEELSSVTDRVGYLIRNNYLPEYFGLIPERIRLLEEKLPVSDTDKLHNFIGGGTDLFVQKPDDLLDSDNVYLNNADINFIRCEENRCIVGAGVTFQRFAESDIIRDQIPEIKNFMRLVASLPIRNSATIGGNIVNASPIGDLSILLLALQADVTLAKKDQKRKFPLHELYQGYKTLAKDSDEYIRSVSFEYLSADHKVNFEKVSKRTHLDIATVNSAICIANIDDLILEARVSAGGVAPYPLLLVNTSAYLLNKHLNQETINEAAKIAQEEISPISDIRGSAEYKRVLLDRLIRAHFITLFPQYISFEDLV